MVPRGAALVVAGLTGLGLAGCGGSETSPKRSTLPTSVPPVTAPAETVTVPRETTTATSLTSGPVTEDSRLRFDGIGPIKVGMTLAEASTAAGRPVRVDPRSQIDPADACAFAAVDGGPPGLQFMVGRPRATDPWRIARVDIAGTSRIATVSGIRIGATEDDVKRIYTGPGRTGTLTIEPHTYVEQGHYLNYDVDGPAGDLLLFETDGIHVTQFRSGEQTAVQAVEGCA
jgi:hypothetical protein